MKVVQINSVCGIRSTGRICTDLATMLSENGDVCVVAYGREEIPEKWEKNSYKICSRWELYIHAMKARIFDSAGNGCVKATKKLVKFLDEQNPDIIHLHNLHGYYVDVKTLFAYLRSCGKPIVWSFYDCWSFTGHCAHFDYNQCMKWQMSCGSCKFKNEYPKSWLFSRSKRNYINKKETFTDIPNMHIIAPSDWMSSIVSRSFMKDYPVHVFPNGIDVQLFKPIKSTFRKKHGLENKFVILGVASFWNELKGINYFVQLANKLPVRDFQIVLVGNINKKENKLPESITWIRSTNNIDELCEIYTMADVFVNPTLQETQGLTTIEALACGTPAIVFDSGGAAECIDATCGIVIRKADIQALYEAINDVAGKKQVFDAQVCRLRAEDYDKNCRYRPFMELYENLTQTVQ